VNLDFITPFTI